MLVRLGPVFGAALTAVAALAPLAPAQTAARKAPPIVVGAFYTSPRTDAAYVRAVAKSLKDHHFNAVVDNGRFTRETLDIFGENGISVITRDGKFMDHPAVIAGLVGGDAAPGKGQVKDIAALKQQYEALGRKTDKPLLPCTPGERLGLFGPDDPRNLWDALQPKVRCFRWYGVARGHYGVLHKRADRGWLSFGSVMQVACPKGGYPGGAPCWVVLQAFGKNERETEYQNPSPAQIRAMMNLALAYGAKGVLLYALQDCDGWTCLVDEKSLKPSDGKYAAAAEVAARAAAHAELIASLKEGGLDIRCPNPAVDAVPLSDGKGRLCVYAVNKDAKNPVTTRLMLWADRWLWTTAQDVFNHGEVHKVKPRDEEGYLTLPLTLAPGEGKLFVTDVKNAPRKRRR